MGLYLDLFYCLIRLFGHFATHVMGYITYITGSKYDSGYTSATTALDVATKYKEKVANSVSIVTGSTGGIGLETVLALAANGGKVVLTYRSDAKREKAMQIVNEKGLAEQVIPLQLELSDYSSISRFVREFKELGLGLNFLINNAGVMMLPNRTLTKHGHERQLGVNHFGHFYLTELLRPLLEETAKSAGFKSRVVNVSSAGHLFSPVGGIPLDNMSLEGRYNPAVAYGQSKLANILHTLQLNKIFEQTNVPIVANACHPGGIPATDLARHVGGENSPKSSFWPLGKTIPQGAATSLYLALDETFETVGGIYASDSHIVRTKVGHAYDEELAAKFYEASLKEMNRIVASLTEE